MLRDGGPFRGETEVVRERLRGCPHRCYRPLIPSAAHIVDCWRTEEGAASLCFDARVVDGRLGTRT